jgi:hypothetical protein
MPNESSVCGNHSPVVSRLLPNSHAVSVVAMTGLSALAPALDLPVVQSPTSMCPVSPLEPTPADSPAFSVIGCSAHGSRD